MEAGNLPLQYLSLFIFIDSNCYDQRCTQRDLRCSSYFPAFAKGRSFWEATGNMLFYVLKFCHMHPSASPHKPILLSGENSTR